MNSLRRFVLLLALVLILPAAVPAAPPASASSSHHVLDADLWKAYAWREIGPYRGGRSAAVAGIPGDRSTYYFGATGGGVWKTTDGGRTWKNVSDGFFGGSIGSVAVSEWDHNVVYVGGGEVTLRGNLSPGSGMWKSTDAGQTWKQVGLADAQHIPRIRIHPKNPDLVYAAVLGHVFGPNTTRGVYRSKDGGATWQRVLFANEHAGAVDLAMDPVNPRVLYAGFWRVVRTPYSLESGGEGSGLWKSTDGGDTWTELTRKPGLPKGTVGIVGVTISPTDHENLYALVEAADGGVFRSADGGATWKKTNDDRDLRQRAWYYSRIFADPADVESVYVPNVQFHRSKDGGKTFTTIGTPHGDNHDLWIDPDDPLRMIESNDGGVNVTTDGGKTWSTQANQPTAQIYRAAADTHFPYRLLGAQQDNSAFRILSRGKGGSIGPADWEVTAGGESGYIVADPTDPEVVYGGSYGGFINRLDHATGEMRDVNAWPEDVMGWGAADLKYRFQWNFPIVFSPNDQKAPHTLYTAAQVLFKSTDAGQSWSVISPDLTRNDKSRQGSSGGPITKDNTSIEYYSTIFTVAESPLAAGTIWAGTDDGLVQLTKDGGKTWTNVTPKGLPEWAQINEIEASPYDKAGAYLAATRYKSDDFKPYLYKTADYGATWTRITDGIDPQHFTRVVRADPGRRGLLFAGTEFGLYASWDDGGHWERFQLNLPLVPVTDLLIKDGDLVAATQGRGFWVLDGLALLREIPTDLSAKPVHLFAPAPAYRLSPAGGFGRANTEGQGQNPPAGAVLYYWLPETPSGKATLDILDHDGKLIRSFNAKPEAKPDAKPDARQEEGEDKETEAAPEPEGRRNRPDAKLTLAKGLNRFVWDLRYEKAKKLPRMILWSGDPVGPMAVPGDYQVRLTVGTEIATAPLHVLPDPRLHATPEDLAAQQSFLLAVRDKLDAAHDAIRRIRETREQLETLRKRLAPAADEAKSDKADKADKPDAQTEALRDAAKTLAGKLTAIEEALYQTKNRSNEDPLNFPVRLNDKLNAVAASASLGDFRPTAQAVQVKDQLSAAIDAELAKLDQILTHDVPAFNDQARAAGVPSLIVSPARRK
ncbi:MAG TPA: exo-alpha-sialidase [Thermoanaerobaculia bacterium]|nr:exo-alpha-sialidase [Thermoanaerobaculia bacterium]